MLLPPLCHSWEKGNPKNLWNRLTGKLRKKHPWTTDFPGTCVPAHVHSSRCSNHGSPQLPSRTPGATGTSVMDWFPKVELQSVWQWISHDLGISSLGISSWGRGADWMDSEKTKSFTLNPKERLFAVGSRISQEVTSSA